MNAVFWIIMIAVSIIVIAYAVLLLRAQHTAKNLKITLWDNCGYSTTKNIHTLYIDDYKKAWYVIGCYRVYNFSEIKNVRVDKIYKNNHYILKLSVVIEVDDPKCPDVYMVLLNKEQKTISYTYKSTLLLADDIVSQIKRMKRSEILTDVSPKQVTQKIPTNDINKEPAGVSYSKIEGSPNDYVVFDLETTGLDHIENDILEIGAIKYNNGIEVDRFHTYVKIGKPIPPFITNLNGISKDTIKDAPLIRTALRNFLNFIGNYNLIAFNSDFDMSFMQYNCEKKLNTLINNDVIDALPLARKYLPQLPNKKLETVKRHFGLTVGSHNAIDDCFVTNYLYQYCRQFEELRYRYAVPFLYDPRVLSDKEVEYLNAIVSICEKSGISRSQLSIRTSRGAMIIVEKNSETVVGFKLDGKLQYVLLQIPFEQFEANYPTEIKHTPSIKSEGNCTRLFVTNTEQLWQFESVIIKKRQRNWTTA